jgi:NAD(P)-dependent dehydrogenase (short-subunit alcohol dehydrogenase family)
MSNLTAKVAVITGASKGIGGAIAKALSPAGGPVVLNFASTKTGADAVVEAITSAGGATNRSDRSPMAPLTSHGIVGRWSASSPAMKSSRSCWAVDLSTWIERRDYALLLSMLWDLMTGRQGRKWRILAEAKLLQTAASLRTI